MIFSEKEYVSAIGSVWEAILDAWSETALQVGIETGVYVVVDYDCPKYPVVSRIYFKAMGREFEDMTTLMRTLKLKAFW